MAEAPDWVTLTEGEEVVWRGRPTIQAYLGEILPGVVFLVVGIAVATVASTGGEIAGVELGTVGLAIGVILVAFGALGILRGLLAWWAITYLVTSEEVYKKRGLVSRTVTNVRLDQIQNTTFKQTVLGRVLSFGSVHIDTAGTGQTEIVFERVPNPQAVVGVLTRQLDALQRK